VTPDFSDISSPLLDPFAIGTESCEVHPATLRILEGNLPILFQWERFSYDHSQPTSVLGVILECIQSEVQPIPLQNSPPGYKPDPTSRIRERSSKALYSPPPRAGVESPFSHGKNVKGRGRTASQNGSRNVDEGEMLLMGPVPCTGIVKDEYVRTRPASTLVWALLL